MSETHYWPTEPGKYLLATGEGYDDEWTLSFDGKWVCDKVTGRRFSTREMQNDGYLGVRIPETPQVDEHAEEIAQLKARCKSESGRVRLDSCCQ